MDDDLHFHDLPHYGSPMFGRAAELAALRQLVVQPGFTLATVIGIGGVGKTRLVVELVRSLAETVPCDFRFVPLAAIESPELVLPEIAKAFDIQIKHPRDTIRNTLAAWDGILVLDNFEQVIQTAPQIASILPQNPNLTVIVTSQQPLHIDGEHLLRINTLQIPAPDAALADAAATPSVRMLVSTASRQDAGFAATALDASGMAAISEICRRLDGIPLALELAAPRLATLSPEAVLDQMDRGQQILSSRRTDLPARQRTMDSAIAWSVRFLTPELQRTFIWLGPLAGGFDVDLVDELVHHLDLDISAIDVIGELMGFCLIRRTDGGANPWYNQLGAIRDYCLHALDDLQERDAAEAFVAMHVRAISADSEEALTSDRTNDWTTMLERELPTIRSAVRWSFKHEDPELAMVLANGIWRFMEEAGIASELRDWITTAEQWSDKLDPGVLAAGLITRLLMENEHGDLAAGKLTAARIAGLLAGNDDRLLHIRFLIYMGHMAKDAGDLDLAVERYKSAAARTIEPEDSRWVAVTEGSLAAISYYRGDYAVAEEKWLRVAAILQQRKDENTLAAVYGNLIAAANDQEAHDRALEYADRAIAITRPQDSQRALLYALLNQAETLLDIGETDKARINLEESADLAERTESPILLATAQIGLCRLYLDTQDYLAGAQSAIKALQLIAPGEASPQFLSLSRILLKHLFRQRRLEDAAALYGKTMSFADETGNSFSPRHTRELLAIWEPLAADLPNADDLRDRGAKWNAATYVRNLEWFARSIAPPSKSPGLLISVPAIDPTRDLTVREHEVLQLLVNGYSTQRMAHQLSVSPRTVTTHIGHIMNKMNVSSRAELLAAVLRTRQ